MALGHQLFKSVSAPSSPTKFPRNTSGWSRNVPQQSMTDALRASDGAQIHTL